MKSALEFSRLRGGFHRLLVWLGVLALAVRAGAQVPVITLQPTNTHAGVGNTMSFAVAATGGAPLSYRWYFNGTPLNDWGRFSGTRSNVMSIVSVRTNDAGNYGVAVVNGSGTVPSQAATLVVHSLVTPVAGAVALWSAEGNTADSIGANPGTAFGVSYGPGWVGQAFQFESQYGDYVWLPASSVVDLSRMNAWTLTAWVWPSGTNYSGALTIYSEGAWYASLGLDLYTGTADSYLGGASPAYSTAAVPSNHWTHVALVYTNGTRTFYINGVNSGSATDPALIPTSAGAAIGGIPGGAAWFDGLIDEVTIFNRALSDAEVQQVCQPGSSNLPPFILQPPAGVTVYAGDNTSLTVAAVGTPAPGYQWCKDGTNLVEGGRFSGTKTAQLTLTGVQPADAGSYTVVLTNVAGAVTSTAAAVSVLVRPPTFTLQPQSQSVTQGLTASFTAVATSAVPISLQWRFKGNPLANGGQYSGVTTTNLLIANVMPTNAGAYTLAVSNAGGTTVSSSATLTVLSYPPVITRGLQSLTVGAGTTVPFAVTATGLQPLSYQWRFNGTNLLNGGQFIGVTTSNLTVLNVQTNNTGDFTVVVTNAHGAVTSSPPGHLTVTPGPAITNAPVSQVVKLGDTVNFTVGASGSVPLTYQWRLNSQPITGATNTTLVLTNVSAGNAGFYDVVITGPSGTTTSAAVSLGFVDLKLYAGIVITGPVGGNYRIDYTSALADPPSWQFLANVTLPSSPYVFIDYASPGVGQRFYRAVPQ